jgi:hypothetical protein
MTNPRHGKERPLYPTKRAVIIILLIAVVLGILIWWFLLRPLDATTVAAHISQHVRPNTGRIIAKAHQAKPRVITSMQLHAEHARHVKHLVHLHAEHVHHLAHLAYEKYQNFEYRVDL